MRFSPDGKWVYYTSYRDSQTHVSKIPLAGGSPMELTPEEGFDPQPSPDGKLLAYATKAVDMNRPSVAIMPVDGGKPLATFHTEGMFHRWSPDGKYLYFLREEGRSSNLWRQPVSGGKPERLTDLQDEWMKSFEWSRDGSKLIAARLSEASDVILMRDTAVQ